MKNLTLYLFLPISFAQWAFFEKSVQLSVSRIPDISRYTKFGIIVASNASVIHMPKPPISASVEMGDFCLLRLCPNPRRTLVRVLEMLENSIGYAILQIA